MFTARTIKFVLLGCFVLLLTTGPISSAMGIGTVSPTQTKKTKKKACVKTTKRKVALLKTKAMKCKRSFPSVKNDTPLVSRDADQIKAAPKYPQITPVPMSEITQDRYAAKNEDFPKITPTSPGELIQDEDSYAVKQNDLQPDKAPLNSLVAAKALAESLDPYDGTVLKASYATNSREGVELLAWALEKGATNSVYVAVKADGFFGNEWSSPQTIFGSNDVMITSLTASLSGLSGSVAFETARRGDPSSTATYVSESPNVTQLNWTRF